MGRSGLRAPPGAVSSGPGAQFAAPKNVRKQRRMSTAPAAPAAAAAAVNGAPRRKAHLAAALACSPGERVRAAMDPNNCRVGESPMTGDSGHAGTSNDVTSSAQSANLEQWRMPTTPAVNVEMSVSISQFRQSAAHDRGRGGKRRQKKSDAKRKESPTNRSANYMNSSDFNKFSSATPAAGVAPTTNEWREFWTNYISPFSINNGGSEDTPTECNRQRSNSIVAASGHSADPVAESGQQPRASTGSTAIPAAAVNVGAQRRTAEPTTAPPTGSRRDTVGNASGSVGPNRRRLSTAAAPGAAPEPKKRRNSSATHAANADAPRGENVNAGRVAFGAFSVPQRTCRVNLSNRRSSVNQRAAAAPLPPQPLARRHSENSFHGYVGAPTKWGTQSGIDGIANSSGSAKAKKLASGGPRRRTSVFPQNNTDWQAVSAEAAKAETTSRRSARIAARKLSTQHITPCYVVLENIRGSGAEGPRPDPLAEENVISHWTCDDVYALVAVAVGEQVARILLREGVDGSVLPQLTVQRMLGGTMRMTASQAKQLAAVIGTCAALRCRHLATPCPCRDAATAAATTTANR